jgi:hypothetical protein
MSMDEFKSVLREQFFMLLIDEEAALNAAAEIARRERAGVPEALAALRRLVAAKGAVEGNRAARLARVETLFREAALGRIAEPSVAVVRAEAAAGQRKPSKRDEGATEKPETVPETAKAG